MGVYNHMWSKRTIYGETAMPRQPGPPDAACESLVRGSLLTPTVRRDVADLNRQFLELGLSPDLAGDARFAWSEPVRRGLLETDEATRGRMAACPFTIFELLLPPDRPGSVAEPRRVEDGGWPVAAGVTASRWLSFVHLALFLAWRLADSAPMATRIALGLPPSVELRLNEMCPSELVHLATWPGLIRPRWPAHQRFWATLAGAGRRNTSVALQWAHCVGICLLGADRERPASTAGEPGARRRPRP